MNKWVSSVFCSVLVLSLLSVAPLAQAQVRQYTFAADSGSSIDALSNSVVFRTYTNQVSLTVNSNSITIGAATNVPSLTFVPTNLVDGGTYTNATGRLIAPYVPCKLALANALGFASYQLQIPGLGTNIFGFATTTSNSFSFATNMLTGLVTNGGTFTVTNISSGSTNAGSISVTGEVGYLVY